MPLCLLPTDSGIPWHHQLTGFAPSSREPTDATRIYVHTTPGYYEGAYRHTERVTPAQATLYYENGWTPIASLGPTGNG